LIKFDYWIFFLLYLSAIFEISLFVCYFLFILMILNLLCNDVLKAGKSGYLKVLVVFIVVAIIVAILLFIIGYCFLAKRAKKAYNIAPAFNGKVYCNEQCFFGFD